MDEVNYHKSPIEVLGYRGWQQYSVFKHHLRMPVKYLRVVVKNYRDLTDVPVVLPRLLSKIHEHWWSLMSDTERIEKIYKVKGVPPLHIRSEAVPAAGEKVKHYYETVLDRIHKFAMGGKVLYLHSEFETNSLLACSQIIKAALANGLIKAFMADFPTCLEEIKTWEESHLLKQLKEAQVACIYMVGKEYSTEFTQAHLETLVNQRTLEGKVTLLSSHLAPVDFKKRYGIEVPGTVLKFEDEKITKTISALLKELE